MIKLTANGFKMENVDLRGLIRFIENIVANEFANMSKDCYYPKVSILFKELQHRTNTDDKMLVAYSKRRYKLPWARILHDPKNVLLILIIQEFVKTNNISSALTTFHLFSIRQYSNYMHKLLKQGCNPDYWRAANEKISHSHLFRRKETIANFLLYLSNTIFEKYYKDLKNDNDERIVKMVYELKTRVAQSMRSFIGHYYRAREEEERIKSKGEEEIYSGPSLEQKIRIFADRISKDISIYKKVSDKAILDAQRLTRFNRQLSKKYAKALCKAEYQELISQILNLMLRPLKNIDDVCTSKFLDHIKRLMAVKTSTKPVFFKKSIIELHDEYVIPEVKLEEWFGKVSIQTRKISRDFIAYYLAFVTREYIC